MSVCQSLEHTRLLKSWRTADAGGQIGDVSLSNFEWHFAAGTHRQMCLLLVVSVCIVITIIVHKLQETILEKIINVLLNTHECFSVVCLCFVCDSITYSVLKIVYIHLYVLINITYSRNKHNCVLSNAGLYNALTETGICTSLKSDFNFWFHSPLNTKSALPNIICTWNLVLIC